MNWRLRHAKSHTTEELLAAIRAGKRLAALDTAGAGDDDILIMDEGDTLDTLQGEVNDWLDQPEGETSVWEEGSNQWTLREIDAEEIADIVEEHGE